MIEFSIVASMHKLTSASGWFLLWESLLELPYGSGGGPRHASRSAQVIFGLTGHGSQAHAGDLELLRPGDVPQPAELVLGHALLFGSEPLDELVLIGVGGVRHLDEPLVGVIFRPLVSPPPPPVFGSLVPHQVSLPLLLDALQLGKLLPLWSEGLWTESMKMNQKRKTRIATE